jgi:RNA polymerase sigma-70 factor, ECF subfamily
MTRAPQDDIEAMIRARHVEGDMAGAATAILDKYGRELLEYLVATARSEVDGSEAFARFAEAMWQGLPRFRWDASARTWCYVLARRALARIRRDESRRPGRPIAMDDAPAVAQVAEKVKSETLWYLRSEVRDRVAALREALDPDDQAILILRIDRGLDWREVAIALADEGDDAADEAELTRRTAAIRKRFERIKKQLRERAGPRTPRSR